MNWLNALASLIDMVLALCVDWLSAQYDKTRREVDRREVERAGAIASLEAVRKAAQVEAEKARTQASVIAAARGNLDYIEGETDTELAERTNRLLEAN